MRKYPTTGLNPARLHDLSWLTGEWYGENWGGCFEEGWPAPAGNAMVGVFRWIPGDQVHFYEFVTIEQEAEAWVLRIQYFNPGLIR